VRNLPQGELVPPRSPWAFVCWRHSLAEVALVGLRDATRKRLGEHVTLSVGQNALVPLAPELPGNITPVVPISPHPSPWVLGAPDRGPTRSRA
jgi:hypothetical protein